jgi:DNA invertase Pin-like site-specific DNA recombinase
VLAPQKPNCAGSLVKEVGSCGSQRKQRQQLIGASRRREIDVVQVWLLDRSGRSMLELVTTLPGTHGFQHRLPHSAKRSI